MKNQNFFLSEKLSFLVVKFSVYLNRRVFVMFYYFQKSLYWFRGTESYTRDKSDYFIYPKYADRETRTNSADPYEATSKRYLDQSLQC